MDPTKVFISSLNECYHQRKGDQEMLYLLYSNYQSDLYETFGEHQLKEPELFDFPYKGLINGINTVIFMRRMTQAVNTYHQGFNKVHLDIKPSNFFVPNRYLPILGDLEFSKSISKDIDIMVGTENYFDPIYEETGIFGVYSDIYSLASVLVELIDCDQVFLEKEGYNSDNEDPFFRLEQINTCYQIYR